MLTSTEGRKVRTMIESRSLCNDCPECHHCGRKYQKYKALICDYCHGEVEMAYVLNGDHVCADCLDKVLETVREEDLND